MKKNTLQILILIFVTTISCSAQTVINEWRGIIPLHSMRDDVKKSLGKADFNSDNTDRYKFEDIVVRVKYVLEPCGSFSAFGYYNVPINTVLEVTFEPVKELRLKKFLKNLNITNMDKLETKGEMDTGIVHYFDKKRGIKFAVNSDKTIYSYTFGAKASDSHLLCQEDDS